MDTRIQKYIIRTHHAIPREHAPQGARRPQAGRASEYRNSTYICYAAVGRGRSSVYEAWIMGNEYKVKLDGRKGWDRRTNTLTHTAYWPPVPRVVNWLLSTLFQRP